MQVYRTRIDNLYYGKPILASTAFWHGCIPQLMQAYPHNGNSISYPTATVTGLPDMILVDLDAHSSTSTQRRFAFAVDEPLSKCTMAKSQRSKSKKAFRNIKKYDHPLQ